MTREEAITRLKNMAWLYGSAEREQNIEAIDMAIEALQADAVSRKDTVTLNSPISIQAEMVSVVRCKDCKYYHKSEKYSYCNVINVKGRSPKKIDFCSYGERKGGGDK